MLFAFRFFPLPFPAGFYHNSIMEWAFSTSKPSMKLSCPRAFIYTMRKWVSDVRQDKKDDCSQKSLIFLLGCWESRNVFFYAKICPHFPNDPIVAFQRRERDYSGQSKCIFNSTKWMWKLRLKTNGKASSFLVLELFCWLRQSLEASGLQVKTRISPSHFRKILQLRRLRSSTCDKHF